METMARPDKWPRFHVLVIDMFFLRKIQWNWTIGFTIDELLHFRIWTGANFLRRSLRHN